MDILKRDLAPIPAEAWMEIDEQAVHSPSLFQFFLLQNRRTGRPQFNSDFIGPEGHRCQRSDGNRFSGCS